MSNANFQDLSRSSKALLLLEFLLLSIIFFECYQLNQKYNLVEQIIVPTNILAIQAIIFAFTTQLSMLALGLYNPRMRENFRTILRRLAVSLAIAYLICSLLIAFLSFYVFDMALLAGTSTLGLISISILRFYIYKTGFLGYGKRTVLILGTGERASIIEKRMRRTVDRQSFDLLGFITMPGDEQKNGIKLETTYELKGESILSFSQRNSVDEIVVACDERRGNLLTEDLFACKIRGIDIIEILDFIEKETGQIAVNLIYPSWVIYSNGFASTHYLRNSLDWLLNNSLGITIFILTSPLMLLAIIAIKLEDGLKAPVLYTQERVGQAGQPFKIVKFRSMNMNAESNGAVWSTRNDTRITRVGNFLRKYRIDELPQIYNVMRGEMGFVGPRPERPEFVSELAKKIPYYNERHNVKPGLTGWAQLKYPYGENEEDAQQKLHFDLYYIKHRSILLDLHILIHTAEIVFFGKGR